MNRKLQFIMTGTAILLLAGSLAACGGGEGSSSKNKSDQDSTQSSNFRADTVQVKVTKVQGRDFVRKLNTTGTLNAKQKATVRAKVSGEITHVYVDIGEEVQKGQTLLKIDPTDYRLTLQQAQARLAQAKATLDNGQKEAKRMKGLYKAGSATEQNKDKAKTAYQQAKAGYQQAKAAADQAGQQLTYTSIEAPFNGVVTKRVYKEGDYAAAGQPAVQVTDLSVLEAEMNLPEKYAGSINKDLPVTLTFQSQLDSTRGKVTAVNPQIDTASRTFLVKVRVDNSDHSLSDGLFFNATFKLPQQKNQPAVPASAVQSNQGQNIIWVIKGGKAHRRVVQRGPQKDDWQMISNGADIGETVAVGGVGSLIDGYPVSTSPVDSLTIEE